MSWRFLQSKAVPTVSAHRVTLHWIGLDWIGLGEALVRFHHSVAQNNRRVTGNVPTRAFKPPAAFFKAVRFRVKC